MSDFGPPPCSSVTCVQKEIKKMVKSEIAMVFAVLHWVSRLKSFGMGHRKEEGSMDGPWLSYFIGRNE